MIGGGLKALQLGKQLNQLNAEMADLRDKQEKLAQEYAECACPYEVGQEVTLLGWSHRGKQGRVRSIHYRAFGRFRSDRTRWVEHGWVVTCTVLKKDGTDSKLVSSFTSQNLAEHNESNKADT